MMLKLFTRRCEPLSKDFEKQIEKAFPLFLGNLDDYHLSALVATAMATLAQTAMETGDGDLKAKIQLSSEYDYGRLLQLLNASPQNTRLTRMFSQMVPRFKRGISGVFILRVGLRHGWA